VANRQVVRGVRTGGRSARVREAILAATFDELVTNGYVGLSVESVACRAGVNKTTVYRRWPTIDDLLVEALTEWSLDIQIPDTGTLETDLLALGRELADLLNDGVGREIAAVVLTAGLRSAQLGDATRHYFDRQAVRAIPTIERAIVRGELPPNTDANAILATFRAPLFYRMVTTGDPIDEELIARSARVTLLAGGAGVLSTS
jgi:AcrR family transcriptional regulator